MHVRKAQPYRPDSLEGRRALAALAVNSSLGEWRNIGPSNLGGKVYAAAVDPTNANNVYAAYEVGGLWGTHNGGQTWIPMFNAFQNIAFSSVVTHPTVPGLVAAGLIAHGSGYFTSFNQNVGIALSTNAGNTWNLIGPGNDPTFTVWEIGFGDSTGQVIYAPTNKGLYKTVNQGTTWTLILGYDGSASFFDGRPSLAVDPLNPSVLLLADQMTGVMRSTNGGGTWTRVDNWVNPGPAGNSTILTWSSKTAVVYALAYTNGSASTLSTYKSADEGANWTPTATTGVFNQGMYDMAIAADPFNPNHVIVHGSYIQSSMDGLQTLTDSTSAAGSDCLAVTFDPSHQGVIYDGHDQGLGKSTDGGITWSQFDVGVLTNKAVGGSRHAVATNGVIYTNPADYSGVAYVNPYGWLKRDGYEYNRFYVNPHDPNDLYSVNRSLARAPTAENAAQNIDPAPGEMDGDYNAFEFDPIDGNTIYIAKKNLYMSANRGQSWTMLTLPTADELKSVNVAPSDTTRLYAGTFFQIFFSTNTGASWTAGTLLYGAQEMAVAPNDPNTIYIANYFGGLFKSTDGGRTATQLAGFPSLSVSSLLVDPAAPAQVYASLSNGGGVLVSQDSGATWRQLGSQLPLVTVDWMSIQGRNLYAGTGAGVWELNLEGNPACSQLTFNPPMLTFASVAGTSPLELFVPGNCSWTATSPSSSATFSGNGFTSGHGNLSVTVPDNTAGALRTTQLTIAGQNYTVTQMGGPDPVQNGNVVTLSNSGGCVAATGATGPIQTLPCTTGDARQQFSLRLVPGTVSAYYIVNVASGSSSCINVYTGLTQSGALVAEYPCGFQGGGNETFFLQPQTDGKWLVVGRDSQLCLNAASTGSTQALCSALQEFTISLSGVPVAPAISKSFSPASIVSGGSSTVTLTVNNINNSQLTGAAFTDTLAGMSAAGGPVGGTCVATNPATLTAGATSLSFSGIAIPALDNCTVTFSITSTNVASNPNTTSGVHTDQTAAGGASNTASLIVTAPPVPTVVSYKVICGSACSYNMIGNSRGHLPWQITGVQVVFSQPITSANSSSLTGAAATGLSGLGTTTLTWTFAGATNASLTTALAKTGPNAISSAGGALTGSNTVESLKILQGDFNDDGIVNASDLTLVNNARSGAYDIYADVNGDGLVNTVDVNVVRAQNGQTNP